MFSTFTFFKDNKGNTENVIMMNKFILAENV